MKKYYYPVENWDCPYWDCIYWRKKGTCICQAENKKRSNFGCSEYASCNEYDDEYEDEDEEEN